jgi:tRNA-specific 2-thiouridylase
MKAIAMISGGLDSSLAIKAIQNQGIEVVAIHFLIPFVKHDKTSIYDAAAKKITDKLKCQFRLEVLYDEYLEMLKNPKHGLGKRFNPCIDCKILMLKKARGIMKEIGASFVFTGEVLGQRPMSQNKQSLQRIEQESGLEGLLVRPLTALLLPQTIPQEKGWLKKELLFDIKGRGRRRQIELAEEWGIEDYPWPGGGCLLTDPAFCNRLKDLAKHDQVTITNIERLKIGRYFRISPSFILTVGRNEKENNKLLGLAAKDDIIFEPTALPGPTAIGRGVFNDKVKTICSQIIAHYTAKEKAVEVRIKTLSNDQEETITAERIPEKTLKELRI